MSQTGVKIAGMVVMRLGRMSAALGLPLSVVVLCGMLLPAGWIVSQVPIKNGAAIGLAACFLVAWACSSAAEWVRATLTRDMKKKHPAWSDEQ